MPRSSQGDDSPPPHPPRQGSPSVLDLVRLSPHAVFPPGGEELYRQIALSTGMEAGHTILDAACGRGVTTIFLAETYGVEAHGLDPDADLVQEAEERVRQAGLEARVHIQAAPVHDLPYRDGIFDVAIGEVALVTLADPARAVQELVRVTKRRGAVVVVGLIWTGHLEEERRDALVEHLGARPLLLMEWKQLMRDAGVVELHVEDWSDAASPFRPLPAPAFHDLASIFTLRQKFDILRSARRRWGWRGVRGAVVREQEIHRLLTQQRVLGLSVIRGTKWE